MFKYFLQGANRSIVSSGNFVKVLMRICLLLILLILLLNMVWFYVRTTSYERQILYIDIVTMWKVFMHNIYNIGGGHQLNFDSLKTKFINQHGQIILISTEAFYKSPYYVYSLSIAKKLLLEGVIISLISSFIFLFVLVVFLTRKGKKLSARKLIKGVQVVSVSNLNKLLKFKKVWSPIKIGATCYPKDTEVEHTLVLGGTRQGKSNFMKSNHQCVMNLGHRQVVFDLDGEYTELFYRPGIDVILSPDDARSAPWAIQFEYEDEMDITECAFSLIPTGNRSGSDKFWIYSAQIIFSSVAAKLQESGKLNTETLLRYLFSIERTDIVNLLKGTEAETLVAEHLEKMTGSIKAVLATHIRCLKYLRDSEVQKSDSFSIKKWMKDEKKSHSTLYIVAKEKYFDLFRPLISLWLNRAISCAMDLGKSFDRRVWFRLDEVDTLQHLPSLKKGLTKGGKAGLCMILGAQSFGQFEENYSTAETKIIFDNCHTRLYFAITGNDTAKWASTDLGEEEFEENWQGITLSASGKGAGNVSSNEQHRTMNVVSYTEIKKLPKRTAYLNLPGEWPVTKLTFNIFNKKPVAKNFVKAKLKPIRTSAISSKNTIQALMDDHSTHIGFLETYKPNTDSLKVDLNVVSNLKLKATKTQKNQFSSETEEAENLDKFKKDW